MRQDELEAFTVYFEEKHEWLVYRWIDRMHFTREDPFYDEVIQNLWEKARMLTAYIRSSDKQSIEQITEKTVKERIAANTNLNDLVSGIHSGREIVYETIVDSGFSEAIKTTLILKTSRFFDEYIYHVTELYTQRKEEIINDKNRFIRKMHEDRLTILGQAAASFAHEFRNPLTVVKGFMTLLENRVKGDQKAGGYFSIINREMASLEDKVTEFLFLSKGEGLEERKTLVDLNQLMQETVEFLYPRFSYEGIEVTNHIDSSEAIVSGIREQLKQVFLNIINNAVEELSFKSGNKRLTLGTKHSKNKVCVSVVNNGSRIAPQVLENIFEPFVTTKEAGTGLGLSVCKQIIEKHGGSIKVTSNVKQTAFYIELNRERGDLFTTLNG